MRTLLAVVLAAAAAAAQSAAPALRLDRLEAGVAGAEALRDARRVQHAYANYLEFALWNDLADLFTENGTATYGTDTVTGREKLRRFYIDTLGKGKVGLAAGQYMPHFAMSPVVSMDPDGRTVRGRWRVMTLIAQHGTSATWEGGIYENEFARENGVWKIARLHYYPAWGGKYEGAGWSETPEGAPYHYTPDRAGTPLPARALAAFPPSSGDAPARLGSLEQRLARLNDEGEIVRLQNAYGYYVDKKLWDDAADLFAANATMEIDRQGVYVGQARIRKAMELAGPQGIKDGELNDRVQLQPVVDVAPDGRRAWARGSELRMTGVHAGASELGQGIFENAYVKDDGVWKIAAMRVYGRMRTEYEKGPQYALPFDGPSTALPPDRAPTPGPHAYPDTFQPPFHYANPAKAAAAAGGTPPGAAVSEARLAAAERALDVVLARVGAENVADAYGYYIDDFAWDDTADLFSVNGWKELSYIGAYIGRERVRASMKMRYTNGRTRGGNFQAHQKTQPVVTVAPDGQSAHIRLRLLQLGGTAARGGWIGGVYENGAVKENGVWKISAMDLDYVYSADYKGGWAKVAGAEASRYAPAANSVPIPPDRPLRGVVFAPFPKRVETGFHYTNPVSGRMPPVMIPW